LWFERGSLAQLVEQLTFNQLVAGSNPARPTTFKDNQNVLSILVVKFRQVGSLK
jgi:hypothetical protein